VCNEKCKHGLGRDFYLFNKEIIYSIRLVPGSNPGQPIVIFKLYYMYSVYKSFFFFKFSIYKKFK
jgi:hypothetical protein